MCEWVYALKAANTGRLFEVLRSYTLQHECGEELFPLLKAYRDAVNSVLEELWNSIEWEKRKIPGKSSGGSYPSTRLTSTAGSTRRSSGKTSSKSGLSPRTGWTQR